MLILFFIYALQDQKYFYRVKDNHSLSEVSIILYGTTKKTKLIKKWNNLKNINHIKKNQVLTLKIKPTLIEEDGLKIILAMWKSKFLIKDTKKLVTKDPVRAIASEGKSFLIPEEKKIEEIKKNIQENEQEKLETLPTKEETSWNAFDQVKELFDDKKYDLALEIIQEISNIESLPIKLLEIKILLELQKKKEAKNKAESLVVAYPSMRYSKFIMGVLND